MRSWRCQKIEGEDVVAALEPLSFCRYVFLYVISLFALEWICFFGYNHSRLGAPRAGVQSLR